MAISWGGSEGRFQVGIDISQSPSSVSASTSSVKLTIRFYVRTSYNSVNDGQTLRSSGTSISSSSTNFNMTSANNSAKLVRTATATISLSYSGSKSTSYSASLSGVFNGATPSHKRSHTVPKRPPGKPSAPGTPSISSVTSSSFKVSWSAPSKLNGSKITSYRVEVSTTSSFSNIVKNPTTSGARSITISGLSANKKYYVRVRAGSTGGASPNSGTRSVTTKMLKPYTPTSVKATRSSDTTQKVTWSLSTASSRPASSITVQRRSEKNSTWKTVASLSGSARSYTDKSTKAGDTYRYQVRANNSSGAGSWASSNTVDTTPTPPSGLKATRSGDNIKLTWSTPGTTGSAANIQIFEAQDGVWSTTPLATVSASATSWTHVAPVKSVTHTYRIRTRSASPVLYSGYSTSQVVQLEAAPNAPTLVSPIGVIDLNQPVRLEWVHNPKDSSEQRQYQWSWREAAYVDDEGTAVPAGAWQDQGIRVSSNEFEDIPDPTSYGWTAGQVIEWRVQTWGSHADASPWSSTGAFNAATGPVVTILTPEDNAIVDTPNLTVEWDYFQEMESPQVAYEARLYAGTDTSVDPVEMLSGSASVEDVRTATFTTPMPDSTTFTVAVRARSGNGLWSGWDARTVTVSYLAPPIPTVDAVWNPDQGSVEITITNPDPAGEEPPATSNDVYRQVDGEEWTLIESGVPVNGTVIDPAPPLGGVVRYRATAWSDLPSAVTGPSDSLQFIDGTDPSCSRAPAYSPGEVLRTNRAPNPQWVGMPSGDCSQNGSTATSDYEPNGGPPEMDEGFQHIVTTQDAGYAGTLFPIERTNIVNDPSFETVTNTELLDDSAGGLWNVDARVLATVDTTDPRSGAQCVQWKVVATVTDTSTYIQTPRQLLPAVEEGQWAGFLWHTKWLAGSRFLMMRVQTYDSGGNVLDVNDVYGEAPDTWDVETPFRVTFPLQAAARRWSAMFFAMNEAENRDKYPIVGSSWLIDDLMVMVSDPPDVDPDGSGLLEMMDKGYFDGNTPDGEGYQYGWVAGANTSPSTARPRVEVDDTEVCGGTDASFGTRVEAGAEYGFSSWLWSKRSTESGGAWEYVGTNMDINPREDPTGDSGSFSVAPTSLSSSTEFIEGVETPDENITTVRQSIVSGSMSSSSTTWYAHIYSTQIVPAFPGQRVTYGWLLRVTGGKNITKDMLGTGIAWRKGTSAGSTATSDGTLTDMGNGWYWATASAIVPEGNNGALAYGGIISTKPAPKANYAAGVGVEVTRTMLVVGDPSGTPTAFAFEDYIDGEMEDTETDRYDWADEPHASNSIYYQRESSLNWAVEDMNEDSNPREIEGGMDAGGSNRSGWSGFSTQRLWNTGVTTPDTRVTTSRSRKYTASGTAPSDWYTMIYGTQMIPAVPGQRATFGTLFLVKGNTTLTASDLTAGIFTRVGTTFSNQFPDATFTDMGDGWYWVTGTAIIPDGDNAVSCLVRAGKTSAEAAFVSGMEMEVTRTVFLLGASLSTPTSLAFDDYFDGDTTATDAATDRYEWMGTVPLSTSRHLHREPDPDENDDTVWVQEAENLIQDPRYIGPDSGPPSAWTQTDLDSGAPDERGYTSFQVTSDQAAGLQVGTDEIVPVTVGETYTGSLYARSSRPGVGLRARLAWRDASQSTVSSVDGESTPASGGWERLSISGTAPEGAVYGQILVVIAGVDPMLATGDVFDVAQRMIETGNSLNPYFDGDTPDVNGSLKYDWTGAANASTSTRSVPAPGSPSPFDMRFDLQFYTSDGVQIGETQPYPAVDEEFGVLQDDTWYEVRDTFVAPPGAVMAILTPHWTFEPDDAPAGSEFGVSSLIIEMLVDANGTAVVDDPTQVGPYFDGDRGEVTNLVIDPETGEQVPETLFYEWLGAENSSMSVQRNSTEAEQIEVESVWISGGEGFSITCRAFYSVVLSVNTGLNTRTLYRFAGREWPVEYSGTDKTTEIDLSFMTRPVPTDPRYGEVSMLDEWEALAMEPGPHLYRDYTGRSWQCSISVVAAGQKDNGWWDLSLKITRTDGDPNVDASIMGVEDEEEEEEDTGEDENGGDTDDDDFEPEPEPEEPFHLPDSLPNVLPQPVIR